MKRTKMILVSAVMLLTASTFAIPTLAASTYRTPAEAAAGVIGKPVDEVIRERQESGKTYGAIAAEEGKLEEFKEEVLTIKKARLQDKVDNGTLTQEQADAAVTRMEENRANCDGTGTGGGAGACQGNGVGQGQGQRQKVNSNRQNGQNGQNGQGAQNGQNAKKGQGRDVGSGRGTGQGKGLRDGSCIN